MLVAALVVSGVLIGVGGRRPVPDAASAAVPDAALAAIADHPAPTARAVASAASPAEDAGPPRASADWVADAAARSGIPPTAVAAYGDAALRLAQDDPSCHLAWNTLAGIGTVESANGTTGGRTLGADGRSSRPIDGPALDGTGGNQAIRDAAGGWTTARGPLQFIPDTWARWGADGDGDGVVDVDDIFDASLAAARYLCADGRDLATDQGWADAIYAYNHTAEYVRQVLAAANAAVG